MGLLLVLVRFGLRVHADLSVVDALPSWDAAEALWRAQQFRTASLHQLPGLLSAAGPHPPLHPVSLALWTALWGGAARWLDVVLTLVGAVGLGALAARGRVLWFGFMAAALWLGSSEAGRLSTATLSEPLGLVCAVGVLLLACSRDKPVEAHRDLIVGVGLLAASLVRFHLGPWLFIALALGVRPRVSTIVRWASPMVVGGLLWLALRPVMLEELANYLINRNSQLDPWGRVWWGLKALDTLLYGTGSGVAFLLVLGWATWCKRSPLAIAVWLGLGVAWLHPAANPRLLDLPVALGLAWCVTGLWTLTPSKRVLAAIVMLCPAAFTSGAGVAPPTWTAQPVVVEALGVLRGLAQPLVVRGCVDRLSAPLVALEVHGAQTPASWSAIRPGTTAVLVVPQTGGGLEDPWVQTPAPPPLPWVRVGDAQLQGLELVWYQSPK